MISSDYSKILEKKTSMIMQNLVVVIFFYKQFIADSNSNILQESSNTYLEFCKNNYDTQKTESTQ